MLKRLEIENFRGFQNRVAFDLTAGRYDFCPELVRDGFVKNAIVYGPNGIGKNALGLAIFDLVLHLTDKKPFEPKQVLPYVNLESGQLVASFKYVFAFAAGEVVYEYAKFDPVSLAWERLSVNDECLLEYDFRQGGTHFIKEGWAGSLNVSLPDNGFRLSNTCFAIRRPIPSLPLRSLSRSARRCSGTVVFRMGISSPVIIRHR